MKQSNKTRSNQIKQEQNHNEAGRREKMVYIK
jgi:hypothetical protein